MFFLAYLVELTSFLLIFIHEKNAHLNRRYVVPTTSTVNFFDTAVCLNLIMRPSLLLLPVAQGDKHEKPAENTHSRAWLGRHFLRGCCSPGSIAGWRSHSDLYGW